MALLEREVVSGRKEKSRQSPSRYDWDDDVKEDVITQSSSSVRASLLEPAAPRFLSRTPPPPSRCRENLQSIVGTERFDTTPVEAFRRSGGGGDRDPPDDDPEPRFGDPDGYFAELENLEEDIVTHSSLEIYRSNGIIGDYELNAVFPRSSALPSIVAQSDGELVELCRNAIGEHATYAKTIIHLLRCRNIMFGVYLNCTKLIAADFGGQLINFLRITQGRKAVAELGSYQISSIKHLVEEFDHALSRYLHHTFLAKGSIYSWSAQNALKEINGACTDCLQILGLWDWGMSKQSPEVVWYCASQALDLAVISFAGAHTQNFSRYLGSESLAYDVPGPFLRLPVLFTLRQRHLQCLDGFFGGNPVWVFHPCSMAKTADEPLYLSTNMQDFSHIWGPVWAISASGNLKTGIKRYDVGGGSIYAWPLSGDSTKFFEEEVFCHWLPLKESEEVTQVHQYLGENDTLLIGAVVGLERNQMCQTTISDVELQLQDSNSLHYLRTSDSSYYVDATSSSISLGGWGVNISGTRQWKRRNGQTLKSALLERWSHERDGTRMILDLVKGYGLEMSFCSLNAKRTRLIDLLRTNSMIKYLENFDWNDETCARKVLEVLSKGTVDDLLLTYRENPKWRKDIQLAILFALRILAECSVDEANGDLSIPWISSRTSADLATFKQKDITWSGFLQDKRDTATFGLVVNKCLSFNEEGCRSCGNTPGKAVLQTSIRINRKMQDNWMKLKQRPSGDYFWSISVLYKKLRFPLGSQGSLTALKVVGGALLVEWTSEGATKAFFKKAIHWNEGMHHQEYIRAKWNATDYPIHVLIEGKHPIKGSSSTPNKLKKRPPPTSNLMDPLLTSPASSLSYSTLIGSPDRSAESLPGNVAELQAASRPPTLPSEIEDTSDRRPLERRPISSTQSSAPVPAIQSGPFQNTTRNEASSDLGSDDEDPTQEKNGWRWDKKFKLWRRHVYTDGELDYTTWSRNPDESDG